VTDYRPGGRRRMDRVLDPAFVEGLAELSVEDLRSRREDARLEERDISYTRRLLQGRLDLLRADLDRRAHGTDAAAPAPRTDHELVDALTSALSEQPATSRPGQLVDIEPPDHIQRRRAAEVAVDDVRLSDPSAMDDDELAERVVNLERLEQQASATRKNVLVVLDALTTEVQRRVIEGEMPQDPAML
jgi:hypothetical protein